MNEDWVKLELDSLADEDIEKLKTQAIVSLKFQPLFIANDSSISAYGTYDVKPKEIVPHDCPRCGAPLREFMRKCDYCRSEFW